MSQHKRHDLCVYIGPAALCPTPEDDRPFIVITGDQDEWALPLIQKRANRKPRADKFYIRQHTIGKPGTTKTWHSFNQPSLNGIIDGAELKWCNPAWEIEHLGTKNVENRKLQDILSDTDHSNEEFNLIIAQGDPQLTLKRSEKLLKNCSSIDLTLHPLALIWKESIDNYLAEHGFERKSSSQLLWQKAGCSRPIQALASPSESEHFIHPTVQYLLQSVKLDDYRKAGFGGSDLFLLRQVTLGKINYKPKSSISKILKTRAEGQIQRFIDVFTGTKTPTSQAESPNTESGHTQTESLALTTQKGEDEANQSKRLRGHIDGFQDSLMLRGWVDASDFGEGPSTLSVIWEERNQVIGEGAASLERPDLAAAGINIDCGFAIDLKILQELPLIQTLDEPISLKVIESKSQESINQQTWKLDIKSNQNVLGILYSAQLKKQRKDQIYDYLKTSNNSQGLLTIRQQILRYTAMQCLTNRWQELPVIDVINCYNENSALNYGSPQESVSRLELVLLAWIKLIATLDSDGINRHSPAVSQSASGPLLDSLDSIASNLQERVFVGLQKWEKALFDEYIRPLYDVFIATIFLQKSHARFSTSTYNLLDTLSSILHENYSAPKLAFHLRSILKSQNEQHFDDAFTKLAHERGDRFTYLLCHYTNQLEKGTTKHDLFYYAAAIDFATYCPAIHRNITTTIQEILPTYLAENPRQSKPRHWVERLGHLTSNSAQMLVSKMISLNCSRSSVIDLHQEMIQIKKDLVNLLWNNPSTDIDRAGQRGKPSRRQKWLIVGEKELAQCWMYRVLQKKAYLENMGCEVRCIDQEELRYWSFTHDIVWADAVIFCRLPAMYPYLRAIAFAKQCGKHTYAEIDDLIFTSDYPADFQSYGGSIPIEQYKNLCVDYPLRLGILNAVDEVIVSTSALADACRNVLDDKNKPVQIVPNLPLAELEKVGSNPAKTEAKKSVHDVVKIALTSGTLSHKQILKDFIYPVLFEALEEYSNIELIIVGHIELPSNFSKFSNRIQSVPFSSYSAYLNLLEQASIALVPLEVHPTTHAKSAIKWMEASLCGVTCICSPVKAYTDVTTDQKDVLIASNLEQWRTSLKTLIEQPEFRQSLAKSAYQSAMKQFNTSVGQEIWTKMIQPPALETEKIKKKVLVINVFFAPQSVGGATRVAQDYVANMLSDKNIDYDVTVLCTEYDRWQADIGKNKKNIKKGLKNEDSDLVQETNQQRSLQGTSGEELIQLQSNWIEDKTSYRDSITIDHSTWKGARVIRLNLPAKPWSIHEDEDIEAFCRQFFKDEKFDLIQCHCCQILTASPLVAAQKLDIPYEIIMHDAWWMSDEQFLVSPAGRLINPADPLDHIDGEPCEEEKSDALARRKALYTILAGADRRIAVSAAFQKVCESAGISDVVVQENQFTSMASTDPQIKRERSHQTPIKVCHIGGMSLHKGYQLFRRAIHSMPKNLNLEFTVVDHRLTTKTDEYGASWNGYTVRFIAPVAMDEMNQFYASQDVLVAPSIWPESFGLVTREALSAGLWVIASNSGALAEPLLNSESPQGTVIRPNELDDLIKALTECTQHLREYV